MKKIIRNFLNKRNYEIIKQPYRGDKYPNLSKNKLEYYCETPIGKFYLPLEYERDAVTSCLVRGKLFEPEIIEIGKRYITEGSAVIDLGANFGSMTLAFSKFVGKEGKVFAVEGQKAVFDFLKKNVEANECSNVNLFNNAAHYESDLTVYFPKIDFTDAFEFKSSPFSGVAMIGTKSEGIPVKTITIDSLNIETPVSFMKVDIQGADLFGMKGATETIKKYKPAIIFEFEQSVQDRFGTTFNDYAEFVHNIGYKFAEVIFDKNYIILPK